MKLFASVNKKIKFREKDSNGQHFGGPMYYLKDGLNSKFLAGFYALMAIFSYIIIERNMNKF